MRPLPSLFVVLFIFSGPLIADEPQSIDLTIHAQAIETPALKYRLFPAEGDLKPENAIPILLRLPWDKRQWMSQVFPTLHEWVSRPLDAEEWATSGGVISDGSYKEMKRAAFRRDATWEYPIGETSSPHLILLPDVQEMRGWLAHGLSPEFATTSREMNWMRRVREFLSDSRTVDISPGLRSISIKSSREPFT